MQSRNVRFAGEQVAFHKGTDVDFPVHVGVTRHAAANTLRLIDRQSALCVGKNHTLVVIIVDIVNGGLGLGIELEEI